MIGRTQHRARNSSAVQKFNQKATRPSVRTLARSHVSLSRPSHRPLLNPNNSQLTSHPKSLLSAFVDTPRGSNSAGVKVRWSEGEESSFDAFWLRDNDPSQIHPKSIQRLTETEKIRLDIAPSSLTVSNESLNIEWNDGHRSSYPSHWLQRYSARRVIEPPSSLNTKLWDASTFPANSKLPGVEYQKLMETPPTASALVSAPGQTVAKTPIWQSKFTNGAQDALAEMLDSLYHYGFAIVSNTPVDVASSRAACERIGPCRNTIFGDFWDFTVEETAGMDQMDYSDTAYTPLGIYAHTDGNYLFDPPGLQSFHILHHNGVGGFNSLVDGWKLHQKVKDLKWDGPPETHPINALTSGETEFYYSDTNYSYRIQAPVFKLNAQDALSPPPSSF